MVMCEFIQNLVQRLTNPQVLPLECLWGPSGTTGIPCPIRVGINGHQVSGQPLTSDRSGSHLWSTSSGNPGPCQATVASY